MSLNRDPLDARILGVIDVSGLAQTYSRYCLALTVSLAGRIESRIAKNTMARRLQLLDRCAAQFGGRDAVLLVDEHGHLVKANAHVVPTLRRLGFDVRLDADFVLPELDAGTQSGPEWLRRAEEPTPERRT